MGGRGAVASGVSRGLEQGGIVSDRRRWPLGGRLLPSVGRLVRAGGALAEMEGSVEVRPVLRVSEAAKSHWKVPEVTESQRDPRCH